MTTDNTTVSPAKYVIATTVPWEMDEAIERTTEALKVEGFGVLTTIDVQATLKMKIDKDVPGQVILGACNPNLAHRGMEVEPNLGTLLPCNVVVREVSGGTEVAAMEPLVALGMIGNLELDPVAQEAHDRLARVIETLSKSH